MNQNNGQGDSQGNKKIRFQYFVAVKGSIVIVTLVGDLNADAVDSLKKCKSEIERHTLAKLVILYFRDVEGASGESISILAQIQNEARSRSCIIRVSSILPKLKEKLINADAIRLGETANNLRDALHSFTLT